MLALKERTIGSIYPALIKTAAKQPLFFWLLATVLKLFLKFIVDNRSGYVILYLQGEKIMKKTFAQLKRDLQIGVKVKTLYNYCKPERIGEIRPISQVQTNAIAFKKEDGRDSWLWWEKASQYDYNDNIVNCYNKAGELEFTYEILAGN